MDVKVELWDGLSLVVSIDDDAALSYNDDAISKEYLAAEPVRFMLESRQIWLQFGFDLAKDQMIVHFQGVDIEDLLTKIDLETEQDGVEQNQGSALDENIETSGIAHKTTIENGTTIQ